MYIRTSLDKDISEGLRKITIAVLNVKFAWFIVQKWYCVRHKIDLIKVYKF
jgi:hypothetical protein